MKKALKTGWLSFESELEGSNAVLYFKAELDISRPASVIWEQMALAFSDTQASWIWPTQYSHSAPVVPPLRQGASINTTYKMPRRKDPTAPHYEFTYGYRILQFDEQRRTLEYHTGEDHPFNGGAVVRISEVDDQNCKLHWDGKYTVDAEKQAVGESFGWFFPLFIESLEERIAQGPP